MLVHKQHHEDQETQQKGLRRRIGVYKLKNNITNFERVTGYCLVQTYKDMVIYLSCKSE